MSIGIKNICIIFFLKEYSMKALLHRFCFIISQFLQKLSFQKPCWDQAILAILVNKQVAKAVTAKGIYFSYII